MMMTLRRIAPLVDRARRDNAHPDEVARLARALEQRRGERGSSKLGRRLRRKHLAGRAGAF